MKSSNLFPGHLILGPPGTGKTTFLLKKVSEDLSSGIPIEKIGYISFSRQAINEAKSRLITNINKVKKRPPFFRTLHSLAFSELGLKKEEVISSQEIEDFLSTLGVVKEEQPESISFPLRAKGSRLLAYDQLCRISDGVRKEVLYDADEEEISEYELSQFVSAYGRYKDRIKKIDYTDMLSRYLERDSYPQLDRLYVDEVQDLSRIQWEIVRKLAENAQETYLAGDDDQSIYGFIGADPTALIEGEYRSVTCLDKSYRLPKKVYFLARGVIQGIHKRRPKKFTASNKEGIIEYEDNIENIDFSSGSWLVLCRHTHHCSDISESLRELGVPHSFRGYCPTNTEAARVIQLWEQHRGTTLSEELIKTFSLYSTAPNKNNCSWLVAFDKFSGNLRSHLVSSYNYNGVKDFGVSPRIIINTLHGCKGAEAENVVLLPDMTKKTYSNYEISAETEIRVFYVGITRARERLIILSPRSQRYFERLFI